MVEKTAKVQASDCKFHEINIPDFESEKYKIVTDFYAATHKDGFIIYKKIAGNHQPEQVKFAEIKNSELYLCQPYFRTKYFFLVGFGANRGFS